ncbi:MAG: hypothetical protein GX614_13680, partial [Sandaracinaceae bacterium]|nr:hypothetical protein [Sandaracinaceae bacterium]
MSFTIADGFVMRSLLRAELSEPPEEREVFMSADEPREPGALDELGFML